MNDTCVSWYDEKKVLETKQNKKSPQVPNYIFNRGIDAVSSNTEDSVQENLK